MQWKTNLKLSILLKFQMKSQTHLAMVAFLDDDVSVRTGDVRWKPVCVFFCSDPAISLESNCTEHHRFIYTVFLQFS